MLVRRVAWTVSAQPALEAAAELYTDLPAQSTSTELDMLRNLAAAYAEAGRFPEAIETAQKAIAMAKGSQKQSLASEIASRLALYTSAKPFHQ